MCVSPWDPLEASGFLSAVHRFIWGRSYVFNQAFSWNSISSFELLTATPRGGCSFYHMGYRCGEDWQDSLGLGEEGGYPEFVYMDDWELLATGKLEWKGSKHWDMETCWNERAFRKNSIAVHEGLTWDTLHSVQQRRARRPCGIGRNEARAAFPQLLPWICRAEARSVAAFCCQSSQAALSVFWILTVSFGRDA